MCLLAALVYFGSRAEHRQRCAAAKIQLGCVSIYRKEVIKGMAMLDHDEYTYAC